MCCHRGFGNWKHRYEVESLFAIDVVKMDILHYDCTKAANKSLVEEKKNARRQGNAKRLSQGATVGNR